MPIRRVIPAYPNPEASCGWEISTTKLRRKRAWWARGLAMEIFDRDIEPEIEILLRNVGLGHAEVYVRLYMIGSRMSTAGPTIMVCCSTASVMSEAEDAIQRSGILRQYPEYKLGASALPLEQPVPARALASEEPIGEEAMQFPFSRLCEGDILATSLSPTLGRRLFAFTADGKCSRSATAGVVFEIGGQYYQLTAGHIDEPEDTTPASQLSVDLEECHFEDDDNSDEEGAEMAFDYESMGRGSLSPDNRGSSKEDSTEEDIETSLGSSTVSLYSFISSPTRTGASQGTSRESDPEDCHQPFNANGQSADQLIRVGEITHHSRGGNPVLDYALIALAPSTISEDINKINIGKRSDGGALQVQGIATLGNEERNIIAVTASGGVVRGVLHAGITYFRKPKFTSFQKLYALQLQDLVVEGDCGAIIIDEKTGNLCGHIVRGCSGTRIAYIVAALDVCEDLKARFGLPVAIASTTSDSIERTEFLGLTGTKLWDLHEDTSKLVLPTADFGYLNY
ncbi:hypothetical protein F5B20DRAFT_444758 [Whalleya microplaca]|nr:hypothetical protein F5B20DRAFT_444758 [Whalleya microplaca]